MAAAQVLPTDATDATDAMDALSINTTEEEWTVPKEVSFVWNGEKVTQKVGANEQTEFRVYAAAEAGDLKSVKEMLEKNDSNTLLPQMAIMGATAGIEDPKVRENADLFARVKSVGAFAVAKGGSMFWQFRHERASFTMPVAATRKSKGSASESKVSSSSSDSKGSAAASE